MKTRRAWMALLAGFLLLSGLACSAPARLAQVLWASPTPVATATPLPTFTALPSPTPEQPPALQEQAVFEADPAGTYEIDLRYPLLPATHPAAGVFNLALVERMNAAQAEFLLGAAEAASLPLEGSYSTLSSEYEVERLDAELFSLRIWMHFYIKGAAHPGSYAVTYTYDLQEARFLELGELFAPGSDYLGALAAICQPQIEGRDAAFWAEGAGPLPENYRNWNLTPSGLLITFNEYQVAPYAAGPQEILIPFDQLALVRR